MLLAVLCSLFILCSDAARFEFDGSVKLNSLATSSVTYVKRSVETCALKPETSKAVQTFKYDFDQPSNSSQSYDVVFMIWTDPGIDMRLIGLAHRQAEIPSAIYTSIPAGSYGYSFTKLEGPLAGIIVISIERNPYNESHVLIIGVKGNQYQSCVSSDSGKSFTCSVIYKDYKPAGNFLFHDRYVMTIMDDALFNLDDSRILVVSGDYGYTWKSVVKDVVAAVFQPNSSILFAMTEESTFFGYSEKPIQKINITNLDSPQVITPVNLTKISGISGFQYVGDFLHVVAEDAEGHKVLKVSRDHGESFNDVHLPTMEDEHYIKILDIADELAFLQVTSLTDEFTGALYTSGVGGLFYSLSLEKHLYSDFYKVESMDGVYLTTQQMDDRSLVTLISNDRGAVWTTLTAKDCGEVSCIFQVFNKFVIADLEKTNQKVAQLPYSSSSARGLIIVHGMFGDKIPYDSTTQSYTTKASKLFISADGGQTWIVASDENLVGPMHILTADSGGIILALPINKPLQYIYYSMDEGECWNKDEINLENADKFTLSGLVSQPGQLSLNMSIMGYYQKGNQTTWKIIDLDFKPVAARPCEDGDFELWSNTNVCYLGVKRTYKRIKKSSWCYLGSGSTPSAAEEKCLCTRADYECDYGFKRGGAGDGECIRDPEFKNEVTFCLDSKLYKMESSGYRLVPGDKCDNTSQFSLSVMQKVNFTDLNKHCDEGDPQTYVGIDTIVNKICNAPLTPSNGNSPLVVAVVILVLIYVPTLCGLIVFYIKYRGLQKQGGYVEFHTASDSLHERSGSSSTSPDESVKIANLRTSGRSYTELDGGRSAEFDVDMLDL